MELPSSGEPTSEELHRLVDTQREYAQAHAARNHRGTGTLRFGLIDAAVMPEGARGEARAR